MLYFIVFISSLWFCNAVHPWYTVKHEEIQNSISRPPWGLVNNRIPFWKPFKSTIFHSTHIALTPNSPDKFGQLWNTKLFHHSSWDMETFLAIGRYKGEHQFDTLKSDSGKMAIWFTSSFENDEVWVGLGLFFVNSKNSNQGTIYAIINDGQHKYNPSMYEWAATGICRNVDFRIDDPDYEYDSRYPERDPRGFHVKLEYDNGELAFSYYKARIGDNDQIQYQECFKKKVDLPKKGFFGFTANTGHLDHDGDHHDILRVQVNSIEDTRESSKDIYHQQGFIELGQGHYHKLIAEKLDQIHDVTFVDKTFDINQKELESLQGLDNNNVFTKMTIELQEIEKAQFRQLTKLTEKFKLMHEKMSNIDEHINEALLKTKDEGKRNIEMIENDIVTLSDTSNRLSERLTYLGNIVLSTGHKTEDSLLKNIALQKQIVNQSSSSSYNLWIVFGVFQVFFLICFLYWRRSIKNKNRKRF